MWDGPCALIVDDDRNSLGEVALRLLRLRVDVFYAKHPGEAWLLAQQEAERIRVLLFPPTVGMKEVAAIFECLRSRASEIPRTLVVIGPRPDAAARERLCAGGVEWALWEPYDEGALRSIVASSMASGYEAEPRKEVRLPTTLLGRAFVGTRRRDAIVSVLSPAGAFLETPSPFPEDSGIRLEIAFPEGSVLLKARVVHARYPSSEGPPCHPSGMGVEFADLTPPEEERVRCFLKQIEDRFRV